MGLTISLDVGYHCRHEVGHFFGCQGKDRTVTELAKYGSWAVVAGGSEGVGKAFASQLARAGLDLVLIARKPGRAGGDGGAVPGSRCPGTHAGGRPGRRRTPSIRSDEASDVEVGLLIYTAGANTCSEPFLDGESSDFHAVIDLNVATTLALVHHFGRICGSAVAAGSSSSARRRATRLGPTHRLRGGEGVQPGLRRGSLAGAARTGRGRTGTRARCHPDAGDGARRPEPRRAGYAVAEPADVAREGLEPTTPGPAHVAGGNGDDERDAMIPTAPRWCSARTSSCKN